MPPSDARVSPAPASANRQLEAPGNPNRAESFIASEKLLPLLVISVGFVARLTEACRFFLNPDEALHLLKQVAEHRHAALWTLLVMLGLRRSEACGLTWELPDELPFALALEGLSCVAAARGRRRRHISTSTWPLTCRFLSWGSKGWGFVGAGWARTSDRRIMSLIRRISLIRGNRLRVAVSSGFDHPLLLDVSQPFAVHRGTHAGHIPPPGH